MPSSKAASARAFVCAAATSTTAVSDPLDSSKTAGYFAFIQSKPAYEHGEPHSKLMGIMDPASAEGTFLISSGDGSRRWRRGPYFFFRMRKSWSVTSHSRGSAIGYISDDLSEFEGSSHPRDVPAEQSSISAAPSTGFGEPTGFGTPDRRDHPAITADVFSFQQQGNSLIFP